MSTDETGTLAAVKACEVEVIETAIAKHNGRIFKRMGDGYLAELPTPSGRRCDGCVTLLRRPATPIARKLGIDHPLSFAA